MVNERQRQELPLRCIKYLAEGCSIPEISLETFRILKAKLFTIMNTSKDQRCVMQAAGQIASLVEKENEILSSSSMIANAIKRVLVLHPTPSLSEQEQEQEEQHNGENNGRNSLLPNTEPTTTTTTETAADDQQAQPKTTETQPAVESEEETTQQNEEQEH